MDLNLLTFKIVNLGYERAILGRMMQPSAIGRSNIENLFTFLDLGSTEEQHF